MKKLTLRHAPLFDFGRQPTADFQKIFELCRAQNDRDGTSYPVPERNVILSLVAEDERGEVRQGYVIEAVPELCVFGCDAEATIFAKHEIEGVAYVLRNYGYSGLHTFVPKQWEFALGKVLESPELGFKAQSHKLAHFFRSLEVPR